MAGDSRNFSRFESFWALPTLAERRSALVVEARTLLRQSRNELALGGLLVGWVLLDLLWQVSGAGDDGMRELVANLVPLPIGFAAAVLAWRASTARRLAPRVQSGWRLLSAAFACFFLGDVVWFAYQSVMGETPFPSLADVGYLAYYPILLLGLLRLPDAFRDRREVARFCLDAATILVGAGMVVWYLVLGPTAIAGGNDPLTVALSIGYPVGDLILLFGIAAVALRRANIQQRRAIAALVIGLIVGFAADLIYGWESLRGTYSAGDASDLGYMVSWLFLALAGLIQYHDARLREPILVTRTVERDSVRLSPLPYFGMLAGFGLVLVLARGSLATPVGGLLIGSVVLSVLVVIRQLAAARMNVRLLADRARRRSEEAFASLVQNSSDIVTVMDVDTTIRLDTPAAHRILGLSGSLVGTRLIDIAHPDDQPRILAMVAAAIEPGGFTSPVEWRLRNASGGWVEVEAIIANLVDDSMLHGLVLNMRDISERKQLEARLTHQAFHDPLTGLANRALFADRVEHALASSARRGLSVGVLFLDLDTFKRVNDRFGHDVGDAVLVEIANRLRTCLRAGDTPARFGGDEFAVLLEELLTPQEALAVAGRVLDVLRPAIAVKDAELEVSASVGVATSGADAGTAADLIRNADVAMYIAKGNGKGRVEGFEPTMHLAVLDRLELEADLRRALERDELTLYYQPIVDLQTDELSGVEALLRWNHPRRGVIEPDQIIPIAEETGLILPIGHWVIAEAFAQAAAWRSARFAAAASPFTISVNLSPRQLEDPALVGRVATAIRDNGLPADSVILEITEGALRNPDRVGSQLQALKALGVRIALDNFGTGHSSLSYLGLFPVDVLKIDRSFLRGVGRGEDLALARGVVELGRAMGLQTVAEGIEEREQLETVAGLGCRYGQGFLFARPMLPAQIDALLERSTVRRPIVGRARRGAPARAQSSR